MGRSEAPLSRDLREETPGRANRKKLRVYVSKMPLAETIHILCVEKLHGVESKFNERDPMGTQVLKGNSIQTTLLSTSQ